MTVGIGDMGGEICRSAIEMVGYIQSGSKVLAPDRICELQQLGAPKKIIFTNTQFQREIELGLDKVMSHFYNTALFNKF